MTNFQFFFRQWNDKFRNFSLLSKGRMLQLFPSIDEFCKISFHWLIIFVGFCLIDSSKNFWHFPLRPKVDFRIFPCDRFCITDWRSSWTFWNGLPNFVIFFMRDWEISSYFTAIEWQNLESVSPWSIDVFQNFLFCERKSR